MSCTRLRMFLSVSLGLLVAVSPVFAAAGASDMLASSPTQELQDQQKDRYIVVLKNNTSSNDVASAHGLKKTKTFEKALNGFVATVPEATLEKLRKDDRVSFVEPDVIVTAFAPKNQPSFTATGTPQPLPTGINRIDAEKSATAAIDGTDAQINVDIAIIDTGIDLKHPDLNVYRNVNMVSWFRNGNDDNGHGTHVAGTAAARDNSIGVVGVAPGARLWAVKVLNQNGSGYMSDIIEGIDYVTSHANEIEVANMSLGCECVSTALDQAINNSVAAGIVYVVAAGNSGKDASTFSPANNLNVITVSALADFDGEPGASGSATCRSDQDDTLADFSNFGSPVDIAAPGVCIKSTWKGGGYSTISGTSMASPHVAGAVALYLSKNAKPTNSSGVAAVRNAILTAGWAQGGVNGFTGDKDAFQEPLLNASSF